MQKWLLATRGFYHSLWLCLNVLSTDLIQKGYLTPMSVKIGEKVLLPEYGGTKVHLEDKVCLKMLSIKYHPYLIQ